MSISEAPKFFARDDLSKLKDKKDNNYASQWPSELNLAGAEELYIRQN